MGTTRATTATFARGGAREFEAQLQSLGKDAVLTIHPGTEHAFNGTRPEVHDADASAQAWAQTVAFLHAELD